jgi:hypothetical protein
MTAPKNPSAFPQHMAPAFQQQPDFHGMTLRDWFAGQMLAGIGTWAPCPEEGWPIGVQTADLMHPLRAAYAYAQADAMLAARGDAA